MTMVHIRLRAPTNGGTRAGVGMVVFQPSARHTDDASVVLPDTFTVVLDEEGEATVDIQPTGPEWCWKTDEQVPYGSIRWFTVPAEPAGEHVPIARAYQVGQIIQQRHYALFVALAIDHQRPANEIVNHVAAGHPAYLATP